MRRLSSGAQRKEFGWIHPARRTPGPGGGEVRANDEAHA